MSTHQQHWQHHIDSWQQTQLSQAQYCRSQADQFLLFDESELCTEPDLAAFENEQANKSTHID